MLESKMSIILKITKLFLYKEMIFMDNGEGFVNKSCIFCGEKSSLCKKNEFFQWRLFVGCLQPCFIGKRETFMG